MYKKYDTIPQAGNLPTLLTGRWDDKIKSSLSGVGGISLLILACVAVYYPVLGNNFLYSWDDQWMIINRYTSGGWTISNLWGILTDFYGGQYSPIFELNTLIVYTIDQYNPFVFHASGLLWHIGNVLLVRALVKRLLQMKYGEALPANAASLAFLTAFLFAVHPVNVESIAWLSATKVLVYAFFFLLGLLCYLNYVRTRRPSSFVKTAVCFVLAFGGKEQAVTFPLLLVLFDWFLNRSLKDKTVLMEKIAFFAMASLFGVVTVLSQGIKPNPDEYSLPQRMTFAGYAVFEYITKSVFPIKLNFLYPFPMAPGDALPARFLLYPVMALGIAVWVYAFRKKTLFVFLALFFCVNLLFSIHLIPMARFVIVADRYLYVSLVAVAFAVSWGLLKAMERWKSSKLFCRAAIALFAAYCLYLGAYTNMYVRQWKDSDTIREYTREMLEKRKSTARDADKPDYDFF